MTDNMTFSSFKGIQVDNSTPKASQPFNRKHIVMMKNISNQEKRL